MEGEGTLANDVLSLDNASVFLPIHTTFPLRIVHSVPNPAQYIHRCLLKKIEKGEADIREKRTISHEDVLKKIKKWKSQGYEIIIYYLKLPSVDIAIERVKLRVAQGGHDVPEQDIKRRFHRSWINFKKMYKLLADSWIVFDTSGRKPVVLDASETEK